MKPMPVRFTLLPLALALAACGGEQAPTQPGTDADAGTTAPQITGAGSTFFFPLVSRWSADSNAATGAQVT